MRIIINTVQIHHNDLISFYTYAKWIAKKNRIQLYNLSF